MLGSEKIIIVQEKAEPQQDGCPDVPGGRYAER